MRYFSCVRNSCGWRCPRYQPYYWDIVKAARGEPERGWGKHYNKHIKHIQENTRVPSARALPAKAACVALAAILFARETFRLLEPLFQHPQTALFR